MCLLIIFFTLVDEQAEKKVKYGLNKKALLMIQYYGTLVLIIIY